MNRNIYKMKLQVCKTFLEQVNFEARLHLKKWDLESIRQGLKLMGVFLGKECSPVFAQRVCRSYQILQLHSALWSSHWSSLGKGAQTIANPGSKRWLLGFMLFSLCEQKVSKKKKSPPGIEESELTEHMRDLDFIHELTAGTVICPTCNDRLVVDKQLPNVKYCNCPNTTSVYNMKIAGFSWVPFVETPDLLIWRQPHETQQGLYVYKVYGYYDDISPADFLATQMDIDYRKEWDNLVLKLDYIERDIKEKVDIVHWEMQWPRMFSNRDYCFARRHIVNEEDGTMVIMNKAVVHDDVPEHSGTVRVKEYWSVMHIKAVKGLNDPGVEFGLTYYDNPGLSLPGWLTNWAAMTAIPDFLNKVRNAARARRKTEARKILVPHSHHPHPIQSTPDHPPHENPPALGTTLPNSTDREILSQFFKENVLEATLNEA